MTSGSADDDGAQLPVALQRTLSRLFTLTLDPGALPLQVTPTTLRASSGGLEISGLTGRLVLGAGAPQLTRTRISRRSARSVTLGPVFWPLTRRRAVDLCRVGSCLCRTH